MNTENTYWNGKGKYQTIIEDWEEKMPARGAADTLNVELVRAGARLYNEFFNNGNCNTVDDIWNSEEDDYDRDYNNYYLNLYNLIDEITPFEDGKIATSMLYGNDDDETFEAYEKMVDRIAEYVSTHEDKELPSWYDKD